MNDDRLDSALGSFYRDTAPTPPDPDQGLSEVMTRVAQTRQRGRWWPLPAFQRPRLPAFPTRELAPASIPATNGHSPARGFTMFSALKFMAASVIVALFGGFLLAGLSTTPQGDEVLPASVRTDILPGVELTVEEVEPGVFHVLNDGVRDLALGGNTEVVAGRDDGIWLLRKNRFFRLGSDAGQAWPEAGGRYHGDFEVTPEGTVWVIKSDYPDEVIERGTLFSSDGDGWTRSQSPPGRLMAIAVAPDGTLWASWDADGPRIEVGHLGPGGWQPLEGEGLYLAHRLHPTDSGDLYAENCGWGCEVHHYEDGAWRNLLMGGYEAFDVAPDGTVWFLGPFPSVPYEWHAGLPDDAWTAASGLVGEGLARFAGGAAEGWTPGNLPDMGLGIAFEEGGPLSHTFRAAPDGSLWASLWQHGPDGPDLLVLNGLWTSGQRGDVGHYDPQCDGLVRFDGETADRFLPGRCVTMDIATDGSVWVLADEEEGKDLYVITPEAVAAAE